MYVVSSSFGFSPVWARSEVSRFSFQWTYFTIGLNQLDPAFSHLLPSSDSRFNPSQRALEEGQVDLAESYKLALETKQRARNKAREEKGDRWEPKFFKKDGEGYVYKGGYWEARQDVSHSTFLSS